MLLILTVLVENWLNNLQIAMNHIEGKVIHLKRVLEIDKRHAYRRVCSIHVEHIIGRYIHAWSRE